MLGSRVEQIAELKFAESCQRQIEAAELQFAELERKELAVPTRVQRQLIVGDHIVEFFAYGISRSIGQRSTSAGHTSPPSRACARPRLAGN